MKKTIPALLGLVLLPLFTANAFAEGKTNTTVRILTTLSPEAIIPIRKAFKRQNSKASLKFSHTDGTELLAMANTPDYDKKFDVLLADRPDITAGLKTDNKLKTLDQSHGVIPSEIASTTTLDPDDKFNAVSVSALGIMYNRFYLKGFNLEAPTSLQHLTEAEFLNQLAGISPTRSEDMHFFVESVLQRDGWEKGWQYLRRLIGNTRVMADSDEQLATSIGKGDAAAGVISDHLAMKRTSKHDPVTFFYPEFVAFQPLKVAILEQARTPELAQKLVDFLESPEGQYLMVDKSLNRMPLDKKVYGRVSKAYPSPFNIGEGIDKLRFDWTISMQRHHVVNALFDVMFTFRLPELKASTAALHRAKKLLPRHPELTVKVAKAESLMNFIPTQETEASAYTLTNVFTEGRKSKRQETPLEQKTVEWDWDIDVRLNYVEAIEILAEAENTARFGN